MIPEDESDLPRFLGRCSREFSDGGWFFVGFNLPILAAQTARALNFAFFEVYEAGAATYTASRSIPSSTTDFASYENALCWRGSSLDVLPALISRLDAVILDAANIDLRGQTNSTAIGELGCPRVRLPGGGGSADAAVNAREIVFLFGGTDVTRIQRHVEHVTARPGPDASSRLLTRWGEVRLGRDPSVLTCVEGNAGDRFLQHVHSLGVTVDGVVRGPLCTEVEYQAAMRVLSSAYAAGYEQARPYAREIPSLQSQSSGAAP
jgi:glutaconate CoA-transferase subunit B